MSAIRELDESPFDYVVAILFDQEFQVTGAYQFSPAACREEARFVERTNSYRIHVNQEMICHPDTVVLTSVVRDVYIRHSTE